MSTASWETLLEAHPFTETTLAETLIGGQAFRWFWEPAHGAWIGTWARHVVRLRLGKTGVLEVQRLTTTSLEEIRAYLAIDRLESLIATLPCNADPVLARLHQRWKGLSLLRQTWGHPRRKPDVAVDPGPSPRRT